MSLNVTTVEPDIFARKVAEDNLKLIGPLNDGYLYGSKPGKMDAELFRVPDVDWDKIPVSEGTLAQPALGAQYATVTVPAGKRWRFLSMYTPVDTSGAGDWYPSYTIDSGTNGHILWYDIATVAAAASTSTVGIGGYLHRAISGGTKLILPIPSRGVVMEASYRIVFGGVSADDRWAAGYYHYQEAPA